MNPYDEFYCRLYTGHVGRYGHEFWEFELRPHGELRYSNGTRYKGERPLVRACRVGPAVVEEVKRLVQESGIMEESDENWPEADAEKEGEIELEVKLGNDHVCFLTIKIGSLADIELSDDKEGLTILYYLAQDLKILIMSLIQLHFKAKPIP